MIPKNNIIDLNNVNNIETSKTYYINFGKEKIQNKIDELEAVKQAVYMILSTEKNAYTMYPLGYGTSLEKYIGKPYEYIIGDIDREIKESLLNDNRILDVYNFNFTRNKENILITFTVLTIFGEFGKEVVL